MPIFDIELTDEILSSNAGIILVGEILCSDDFKAIFSKQSNNSQEEYSDYAIVKSYMGLLSFGKSDYEAIDDYRDDVLFKLSLELEKIPSKERLRQRLEALSTDTFNIAIEKYNTLFIRKKGILKTCLNTHFIPVDFDVTPFDNSGTKKEKVSLTYKKFDGFAPMMTYIGGTGFMLNNEMREGKAHSNCQGTADYIKRTLNYAKTLTDRPLLARFDSGNDSIENIYTINQQGDISYLIKGNRRRTPEDVFIGQAKGEGAVIEYPREGKTIFYNSLMVNYEHIDTNGEKHKVQTLRVIRCVERTIDKNGQYLLMPQTDVDFWNTNLIGYSEKEIIKLYADHGTSEQFHSEYKTDMDLERLPSGKFKTNSLIIKLGMAVFNILRAIGEQTLASGFIFKKRPVQRIRIRKVIQNIMYMACRFFIRNKRKVIRIANTNPYASSLIFANKTLLKQSDFK